MTVRVLHVVSRDQRRGAEASALELSQRLAAAGYRTDLVALSPAREGPPLAAEVLGRTTLGGGTLLHLRQRIAEADVVIAHGSRTMPAVVLASLGLRRGLVYQNIGDPVYWAGTRSRRWRVRLQLARMSAVAALTEGSRRALRDEFGVADGRLSVIGNWRDAEQFRPATKEDRASARRQLGLDPATPVACVVGALSVEKDVGLAIAATLRTPDVVLLVVGDGPQRAHLEAVVGEHDAGRVRFLGGVRDVRPALHASDVLLLTSTSEGVPGVIIEAGMCGLPVVTVPVGFVADVVRDGETGLVTRDRYPDTIAAALVTAIADGEALGARARAWCLATFDSTVVTQQWVRLIERVARTG